jgi:ACS family hexuronate transporter-like MFS transporter
MLDLLGTRRGLSIIIVFWSLACASHGLANGLVMLIICRVLLGIGEGGGFPAATRAVAEWFPVSERSTAMGIINGATGVGGMIALPLIWLLLNYTGWFNIEPWRWVFFVTGGAGIVWLLWWLSDYVVPEKHPGVSANELAHIQSPPPSPNQGASPATQQPALVSPAKIPLATLFQHKETWGIVIAKFLTDAAWYFILFWLPTYLNNLHKSLHPGDTGYNFAKTAEVAWIPHAAALAGCLIGGNLSSFLLRKNFGVNFARKMALFASAIIMPLLILVPYFNSTAAVIVLMSAGYFGQQSWSTLVMVLPTDLYPKRAVGTVAGLVGLGGALGGAILGSFSSYILEHGYSYKPVMLVAGLLHVTAFVLIMLTVPNLRPLVFSVKARAHDTLRLVLKLQFPAIAFMLLGLCVVQYVLSNPLPAAPATPPTNIATAITSTVPSGAAEATTAPATAVASKPASTPASVTVNYTPMIAVAGALLVIYAVLLSVTSKGIALKGAAAVCVLVSIGAIAAKLYHLIDSTIWDKDQAFASCCVAVSMLADFLLLASAASFAAKPPQSEDTDFATRAVT